MKALPFSRQTLSGVLALACTAAGVLATALDAQARLGPAGPAATAPRAPSALAPGDPSPH
jgi:hypothetical protein